LKDVSLPNEQIAMEHIEPMLTEEAARERILARIGPVPPRRVRLSDAVGAFSASDHAAAYPLPMFDNSAMDGYAVLAGDNTVRVIGEQPAGRDRQLRIGPGEAVRIFTGAPIPQGATAVVMQEDVAREGDHIVINTTVEPGDFIRRRGCDLAVGQRILSTGERVNAVRAALLASQGISAILIGGVVSGAVLSTGDELVRPGEALGEGEIYDSNSVLLHALLDRAGAAVGLVEHCPDDLERLRHSLSKALTHHVLVISGGVSVGEHDLVRRALEAAGAEIDLWRVAIKPGKPFLFAQAGTCSVFGLPGNPVSSFVTFARFVRPAVLKMLGAAQLDAVTAEAELAAEVTNDDGQRPHYVRGLIAGGKFSPTGRQESHALFGLSRSNALLRVPPRTRLEQGERVQVEIHD
jgi:molybdopterin molybdotransferase